MLGFVHNLFLIIAGLYILFTSPFSSLSAVLTFTCLRSIVRPYFSSTTPVAQTSVHQSASVSAAAAEAPTQYTNTLTWTEVLLLIPCTGLVLSLAYLLPQHIVHLIYLAKCGEASPTIKRLIDLLMGYDPAKPATWTIARLRNYAAEHNIIVPSGCEKSELVALVDECLTNALLAEHIREENVLDEDVLPNILAASAAKILHYKAYPSYAKTLRQHPQKLQEIIQAGLHQLESLTFVARLCGAQLLSPLSAWLEQVAHADDGGLSFQAALTPAEGAAAAASVCGKFCGDGDMVVRCLDCGADPTCVMCMDCFRHSPCVNHRYRITQGSGGGMCDCGDPTAWKPESFCSRHRPAAAADTATANSASATSTSGENDARTLNPVDTLAEEDREWVVILLRGIVQYISLSLLQYLRICEARKRAKTVEKKSRSSTTAPATTPVTAAATASKDPEATLMDDVALIADSYNWLSGWLVPVTNRLWELMSTTEVAKQIIAQLWMEPLCLSAEWTVSSAANHVDDEEVVNTNGSINSSSKKRTSTTAANQKDAVLASLPDNFSCLHPIFLFETLLPVTDREKPLKGSPPDPWRGVLAKCVGHCLSVAKLRPPVGALMATYAECINAHDTSDDDHYPLHEYQVQVLTNPDVLKYLMTPAHMPYSNATNTVLHRVLSSIFYTLCVSLDQGPRNAAMRTSSVATDGLIFIEHQNEHLSYGGTTVLNYCLTSLPAARYTLVLNRLAWRALAQIHGTLAISGYICGDPNAPTDNSRYPAPDTFARILSQHTWLWFNAMRGVLAALMRLPADDKKNATSAALPTISPAALTAALQVPEEMLQRWTGATQFDAPADPSRRRRVFMQMLNSCRVQHGHDEALLLLQDGHLAAAQAAALQQHMTEEEGIGGHGGKPTIAPTGAVSAAAAPPSHSMHPSLITAIGYAVQMLYEVSRTMDTVFQKQRDGFCQRCHTIVLERQSPPGTAAVADAPVENERAKNEEEKGNEHERTEAYQQPQAVASAVNNSVESNDEEVINDTPFSLPATPALPPSQCPIDVFEYNLLQPSLHATTLSNHLPHMFGTILTAWVIEQRRSTSATTTATDATTWTTRLSGLYDDTVAASAVPSTRLTRPLRTLLDCFFKLRANVTPYIAHDRLTFCQQLLDALVMPQVLIGQVFDGLWRRDSYGVSVAVSMYIGFSRSVAAEFDILMLQVLTMELPPADMAIQILRRFSYAKEPVDAKTTEADAAAARAKRRESGASSSAPQNHHHHHLTFTKYLKGYTHYLRLMLTLVVDSTKAAFHPPLSSPCIDRTVAHYLAQRKASHSTIIQAVSDSVRGGDFGTAEEDEKDANGNVIRFTQLIDSSIGKLTVAQDTSRGKQFRLRDVQTWKMHVSLYQSSILDSQLEEVHNNYRSIALASRAAAASENDQNAEDNTSNNSNRYPLPPTQLSDDAMYAELLPTTRALLHTNALLLPALYILHRYVNTYAPPPASAAVTSPKVSPPRTMAEENVVSFPHNSELERIETGDSEEDSEGDNADDDIEDTNFITREALLHAVTALYLCVQDCRSITRAMKAVENADNESTTVAAAAAAGNAGASGGISWDLVELYLERYRVNELSFTAASCAKVLPLPELVRPRTLLQKLQAHVSLHINATLTAKATTVRVTSADMLHRLRTLLHANADADVYSCVEMVEEILVLTGLATFATAEQQAREEAVRSRKRLIQERQAKLMQRMRSRALKTAVGGETSSPPASAVGTLEKSAQGPLSPSSPSDKLREATMPATAAVTSSLLTKVLLELVTLDCCVCHAATEEPLFLLCHTSTSSVLLQLGALTLPDGRGVHNHLCVCGHAAHKTCVEKLFVRLSVLWQRWNFRSQLFLGPTEFNCPLCNMIVTTLAPVPSLPPGVASPTSPDVKITATATTATAFASLFEELQSGTMHPVTSGSSNNRTEDVMVEFQANLANSAVGFSPSEDIPALVTTEDALQKDNEAAWIQSETIRTFLYSSHLILEGVKAGQSITHRHLISLLSLLVSLMPAKLQAAQAALRANFERTQQDHDSLLLLDALVKPREAAHLICTHVATHVIPEMPYDYLMRLFACAAAEHTGSSHSSGGAVEVEEKDQHESGNNSRLSACFERIAEELETDFPGVTIALWKAVGVLTLLKALLVEDASHAIILSRDSFTLTGAVTFTTLSEASIQTPAARCTAILRMLQYLLPVPHKAPTELLNVVTQDVLQFLKETSGTLASTTPITAAAVSHLMNPKALPYTSVNLYVEQIAEKLLHLPRVYAAILTAFAEHQRFSVRHKEATNPVLCCRCGQHLCMHRQHSGEPPELYQHIRACGGAVGLFLAVRFGTFYVIELTSGRLYSVQSNYTDEYGERDRSLRRGVPLFRNREETQKLIELWMQNKWGAVSAVFTSSNRIDLTEL